MSFDLLHNQSRISSFSNLLVYMAASGRHFSCTLGMGDTRNDNLALFLDCNLSRLLCMSTRMSSDLSHNHTRTISFSDFFAYTIASGNNFSCTLGMGHTQNENLALFLVLICHASCVCRLGCLLTCRTITVGQAHFLNYSHYGNLWQPFFFYFWNGRISNDNLAFLPRL